MLGEVIFAAPAILKTQTLRIAVGPDLTGEERIEGNQQIAAGPFDDRSKANRARFLFPRHD